MHILSPKKALLHVLASKGALWNILAPKRLLNGIMAHKTVSKSVITQRVHLMAFWLPNVHSSACFCSQEGTMVRYGSQGALCWDNMSSSLTVSNIFCRCLKLCFISATLCQGPRKQNLRFRSPIKFKSWVVNSKQKVQWQSSGEWRAHLGLNTSWGFTKLDTYATHFGKTWWWWNKWNLTENSFLQTHQTSCISPLQRNFIQANHINQRDHKDWSSVSLNHRDYSLLSSNSGRGTVEGLFSNYTTSKLSLLQKQITKIPTK